jgi:predicted phage terminase large subunit-like protein
MTAKKVRPPRLIEVQAELGRRSLHYFVRRFAWPALNPATLFVDNWHVGAICEHLEAVARGQIRRLIINMPFRMLKSTIVSQAFPAWDWVNHPSREFLTSSYAGDVAMRDAVDARRIIESPDYQLAFGDVFQLTGDQNVKTRYENDKRGRRTTTSTDAAGTGFGGDIRIVDDPVSAKKADSPLEIAKSVEWWRGTMATRANDPSTGAAIVVHQRLNAGDLTGYLLAEEKGWEHLVLPMRFDPELTKTTSLGFKDPRTEANQLLHPERVPEDTCKALEASIGAYHTQAQLQQNPAPRSGIIFQRSHWKYYKALPQLEEIALSVDCAFKDLKSSDYVAIQVWGRAGANHYLIKRIREHLSFSATVAAVKSVNALFPDAIATLIEDKANGTAVIDSIKGEIPGVIAITPEGGKEARAFAMQADHEAGNVWVPDPSIDPDIETFLTEASGFPGLPHDDEVDGMTQYMNWSKKRYKTMGIANWVKAKADAARAARQQ